jgi:hypothetical protein
LVSLGLGIFKAIVLIVIFVIIHVVLLDLNLALGAVLIRDAF